MVLILFAAWIVTNIGISGFSGRNGEQRVGGVAVYMYKEFIG